MGSNIDKHALHIMGECQNLLTESKAMEQEKKMHQKRPMIVLTGPTAVGKTKLSIALAKTVNGEILSADSMQVYRHMDIGSAKITH